MQKPLTSELKNDTIVNTIYKGYDEERMRYDVYRESVIAVSR